MAKIDLLDMPKTITAYLESVSYSEDTRKSIYILNHVLTGATDDMYIENYNFVQTEELTEYGVAVHPYGVFIIPNDITSVDHLVLAYRGLLYYSEEVDFTDLSDGDDIVFYDHIPAPK